MTAYRKPPRVPMQADRGETLVETMIAVVLLGMLAVGIVAGLGTNLRVSTADAQIAGSEAVLRSYAQAWDAQPYAACTSSANPYPAQPTGFTAPSGYTASLVAPVQTWNGTSGSSSNAIFVNCPATDSGLQALTLKVTSAGGPNQTLTITKRTKP